jgi:hypothetical protein
MSYGLSNLFYGNRVRIAQSAVFFVFFVDNGLSYGRPVVVRFLMSTYIYLLSVRNRHCENILKSVK